MTCCGSFSAAYCGLEEFCITIGRATKQGIFIGDSSQLRLIKANKKELVENRNPCSCSWCLPGAQSTAYFIVKDPTVTCLSTLQCSTIIAIISWNKQRIITNLPISASWNSTISEDSKILS
ncbi:hypothetical protein ATANTOWER_006449 [Ataeniobius toweri]|uniref:Uncharacterized protein n=1 Tax=Ataeniobius toweri TaxID=208326 RepID=A0ABU7AMH6_9TELE|nr:hypothetical protein [Ataeniobius toweri]